MIVNEKQFVRKYSLIYTCIVSFMLLAPLYFYVAHKINMQEIKTEVELKSIQSHIIISMDADLQDPPTLISLFVKKWEDGYDVVYGVRKKRKGSILRRIGYTCFYRVFKALSYLDMPLDAGDASLIDRKVVDIIKQFRELSLACLCNGSPVGCATCAGDRLRGNLG